MNLDDSFLDPDGLLAIKVADLLNLVKGDAQKYVPKQPKSGVDQAYTDAVNRGDMATAQKLVDQAARDAGYTIKAYHGTDAETFNEFDKGRIGEATGISILGDGFYFADNKKAAKQYGKNVYTVYLKQTSPYSATAEDAYRLKAVELEKQGHDGVVLPTGKGNIYMVLDPNQIKSAEAVTYDDDGKVIPLSKRFNPDSNDIRYSLSDQEQTGDPFPLPWTIKGEDVGLQEFPLPEGYIQEQEQAAESRTAAPEQLAPVPEDVAEKTTREKLEVKKQSLETELAENRRHREESAARLDEKIAKLQAEYDGKKNKDTKYANNLLRRRENTMDINRKIC